MTVFSKVERSPAPPRVVVLPPSAFASDWPGNKGVEMAIGLRLLSQGDVDTARREAEREALGFYEQLAEGARTKPEPDSLIDTFNEALLANAVARATCDPNDVSRPYFPLAEDMVRRALTPEGMRRLWDELVLLHKGSGAAMPVATDDEVQLLGRALSSGAAAAALDDEGRKLCAYLLAKIDEAIPDTGYVAAIQ